MPGRFALVFLLCLCPLIASFAISGTAVVPAFRIAQATPTPVPQDCPICRLANGKENTLPEIKDLNLSSKVIILGCPPGYPPRYPPRYPQGVSCNDQRSIEVNTIASDKDGQTLKYIYTVTGGRITGTGEKVTWDLTGALPGTYVIVASVDDGCGTCPVTSRTESIRVQKCPDCGGDCFCPSTNVSGPDFIKKGGDLVTFKASSSGDVTYKWSISSGVIESGQGTDAITVRTDQDQKVRDITATVEFGGLDPLCMCPDKLSETVVIGPASGTGAISGRVLKKDGRPAAGITVAIDPGVVEATFTNENGEYLFWNTPGFQKRYKITAFNGSRQVSVFITTKKEEVVTAKPLVLP